MSSTSTQDRALTQVQALTQDQDLANQVGILKSFLHTCMKFLRDQKVVKGLKELIDSRASKETPRSQMRAVNNFYRQGRT